MKPPEAMERLKQVEKLVAACQPLPPDLRAWFLQGIRKFRLDPTTSLERNLGLRSRSGGRLHCGSTLPLRDRAIQDISGSAGTVKQRAEAMQERVQAHRKHSDPELLEIERSFGPIPNSLSQLQRIIGRKTVACRLNRS